MLATKPIPQASCSQAGSYIPCLGGKPLIVLYCWLNPTYLRLFQGTCRQSPYLSAAAPTARPGHKGVSILFVVLALCTEKRCAEISILKMDISNSSSPPSSSSNPASRRFFDSMFVLAGLPKLLRRLRSIDPPPEFAASGFLHVRLSK